MKKLTLISTLLALCVIMTSCGASFDGATSDAYRGNGSVNYSSTMADYGAYEVEAEKYYAEDAIQYAASGSTTDSITLAVREEKLVYTSRVTLETEDFETANESLHSAITSLGGIIVSENAYNLNNVNDSGRRSIEMTVRIPQENYDKFLSGLSESYNVASVQNSVQNLTEYYYDNENRLKSYRIQEERLFAMLEKAETVTEMLQIEDRLCAVQYEIESLTNTQITIDNDVKYATFHLSLIEVTKYTTPAPKTFGDRLGEALDDSAEAFGEFAEGLLFMFIYSAPYLAILAVIIIVVVVCVKRSNKKRIAKATAPEEDKDEK